MDTATRKTQPDEPETLWVRLKPRDPRKGIRLKRYVVFGLRFDEERGWYKVPQIYMYYENKNSTGRKIDLHEFLREERQDNENPESPLAFDICTEAEAKALDMAAKKALESKASALEPSSLIPNDLTSADLADKQDAAPTRRRSMRLGS